MLRPSVLVAVLVLPLAAQCADAQSPASSPAETCIARATSVSHNTIRTGRKTTHEDGVSRSDETDIEWRASGCEVKIRIRGTPRFTDDWRGIASLDRDGSFRVNEDGRVERELEIRPGEGGALRISYEVEGREQPLDAQGQAWLESVLLQLFRRSAYAADERVQSMVRAGGADAVLAEIALMHEDYPRHAYSVALLKHSPSDAALQARVLESATRWSSDYYKSELLEALTGRTGDARVVRAGWNVARTLDSDYYATKGIQRLLALGAPDASQAEVALAAIDRIDSDYYRAELLKTVARQPSLEGKLVPLYVRAVERTESDYYRAEMLSALVARSPLTDEQLLAAIRATSTIKSDYYRSESLARIARKHELKGAALEAYLASTDAIGSDHYRGAAIRAVRQDGKKQLLSY